LNRRELIVALGGCLLSPFAARAQQAGKIFRVGWASAIIQGTLRPFQEAFVSALRSLGYVAGQNIVYDIRYGDNDLTRVPALIDELISLKPDVLVGIEPVARVMLSKTSTIPIVVPNSADPVAAGLVKNLAHPGGNVIGVSMQWAELGPKEIELLREALPSLTRIAHLPDVNVPASRFDEQITSGAAHSLQPPGPWPGGWRRFTCLPTSISASRATDHGRDA
jgi:putative ABC transport system substrate-binding protein